MDQKILFEIKKFKKSAPVTTVFFTDRNKVLDFKKTIANLPKNSAIIIREYDLDKKAREIFAREIVSLARPRGFIILVGKDLALAHKIKADGVHFSDFDQLTPQVFKKESFPKKFIFSLACHSFKSILSSAKLRADLVFISPIFPTTSHSDAKKFGLRNLAKIAVKTKKPSYCLPPIFALGGVNLENIKSIRKLGISGFGAIELFTKNL